MSNEKCILSRFSFLCCNYSFGKLAQDCSASYSHPYTEGYGVRLLSPRSYHNSDTCRRSSRVEPATVQWYRRPVHYACGHVHRVCSYLQRLCCYVCTHDCMRFSWLCTPESTASSISPLSFPGHIVCGRSRCFEPCETCCKLTDMPCTGGAYHPHLCVCRTHPRVSVRYTCCIVS